MNVVDPIRFKDLIWPNVRFYDRQYDIIYSVMFNAETVVPAGNKLGKDFVSAFIVLWFFLTRNPCRIVTTSAKDDHLRVLWGEIERFIATAAYPLRVEDGGPLYCAHHNLTKLVDGAECPISYVRGLVASAQSIAALQGHHANPSDVESANDGVPRTLFVSDESSSVPDEYFTMARTWASRMLIIGNTWPCENHFKHAVKGKPGTDDRGGDRLHPNGRTYLRKVIRIRAADSPNVIWGMKHVEQGLDPPEEILIPGVKTYDEYINEQVVWDEIQRCVSHDADWYEGAEVKLYPADWLNLAEAFADSLKGRKREAKSMGVDAAEGMDDTAWAVVDEFGLMDLRWKKTGDTSVICDDTIALIKEYGLKPETVMFDRGGGGKQHADFLRKRGYKVRTIGFGEAATDPGKLRRRMRTYSERFQEVETKYEYKNRRAELFGMLRVAMNPTMGNKFAIPSRFGELRRQLAAIPLQFDSEGRLELPPKRLPEGTQRTNKISLIQLIGRSPDHADAVALANYSMRVKGSSSVIRAMK